MSKSIVALLFLILLVLYEKARRPIVCERKIIKHIKNIGGEICNIEKISLREEVYQVNYTINGELENSVVNFSLFYREDWKQ